MPRSPNVAELVAVLEGRWEGRGTGGYPTIDPFEYREITAITGRSDHPALLYDQRTWRQTPDGEVVSHWETGLVRISSDGSVRVHNAQAGRTETLVGTWSRSGDGWTLRLGADSFSGDDRVVAAKRTIEIAPGRLTYEMWMTTTAVPRSTLHLSATLTAAE